jgi:uncharacterized protein (TIGR02449 family)
MSNYSSLQQLSKKLGQLIDQCEQLRSDNHLLREREREWLNERLELIKKNTQASKRVQAVINHLKTLKEEES